MNSKTYKEFVEKFKPKKTIDDCRTPPTQVVRERAGVDKLTPSAALRQLPHCFATGEPRTESPRHSPTVR